MNWDGWVRKSREIESPIFISALKYWLEAIKGPQKLLKWNVSSNIFAKLEFSQSRVSVVIKLIVIALILLIMRVGNLKTSLCYKILILLK